MEAGKIFNYRFARTGRAVFYDGTLECAEAIQRAMPDVKVSYDENSKILKINKDTAETLLPKDIRSAYPNSYIIPSHAKGRVCVVMNKEEFERSILPNN